MNRYRALFLLALLASTPYVFAQVETSPEGGELLAPPSNFIAEDTPLDNGNSISLSWNLSPEDIIGKTDIEGYIIERSTEKETGYQRIAELPAGTTSYTDTEIENKKNYYYKVYSIGKGGIHSEPIYAGPVIASTQWFNPERTNMLVASILLSLFVLYFIFRARKGEKLYIRPIAGLEAVQEAIGRATEMGKPVLYIPGIMDMDDIQTIAGITILGKVARMVAEYDAEILVPCCRSLVMTIARETVKEAYLDAGRPDAFKTDNIRYLTDDQFGYVAAVDGIMLREKPAANFYLGTFYAESLILAETGHSVGAIQIAGTAMPSQLPFFVAACDYTLIGEELFAASAYLSGEPLMLGSLIGQDMGKVIILAFIIVGSVLETFGVDVSSLFLTK